LQPEQLGAVPAAQPLSQIETTIGAPWATSSVSAKPGRAVSIIAKPHTMPTFPSLFKNDLIKSFLYKKFSETTFHYQLVGFLKCNRYREGQPLIRAIRGSQHNPDWSHKRFLFVIWSKSFKIEWQFHARQRLNNNGEIL
jgi:hypothetical protein